MERLEVRPVPLAVVPRNERGRCRGRRIQASLSLASISIFVVSGSLLFESQFFTFNGGGRRLQIATFVGLPLLFSTIAALLHRSRRFNSLASLSRPNRAVAARHT
jgi:hypothetical protein